jgi:hypothetical protein
MTTASTPGTDHPLRFWVDHPDRELNRVTTRLRMLVVIPIATVLGAIGGYKSGGDVGSGSSTTLIAIGGTGLLLLPVLLMIVFRQKYPRWWFDWNLALLHFTNRVGAYVAFVDDHVPSTESSSRCILTSAIPTRTRG